MVERFPEEELRHLTARCADLVNRAVLTLSVIPDRELAMVRGRPSTMPEMVISEAERQETWGLDAAIAAREALQEALTRRARRFRPSPKDVGCFLEVFGWLTWLEQPPPKGGNDRAGSKILQLRAHDVPLWKIAGQFGRSEDTIRRWEAAAHRAITVKFWKAIRRLGDPA